MCNWIEREDERWPLVLRRWVEDLPCDVCIIRYGGSDPLQYARAWNRPWKEDRESYEYSLRRWLAYYERLKVREIGQGIVILRRTCRKQARVLLREGVMLPETGTSVSEHSKAIFRATDIGTMSDSDLLESRLVPACGLTIDHSATYDAGRFVVPAAAVYREPGLGISTVVDEEIVEALLSLRPDRALMDVVAGLGLDSSDHAEILPEILSTCRELISLGLVLAPERRS